MKQTLRILVLSVVSVVALSGCMRMEMSLELSDHDTASGSYVMAIKEGTGEQLGATSDQEAADELFGDLGDGIEGASVTEYHEDGYVGTKATFEDQTFADLNLNSDDMRISREGDEYVVAGTYGSGEAANLGELPDDAVATLAITFPGKVAETNGTVEGNTVTWDLKQQSDDLYARGAASGDSGMSLWLWLAIGFVALVVVAGVVVLILGSRRSPKATTPEPPAAPLPPRESFNPEDRRLD
ncbi:LppM family (lipo)protein [Demequina aurantiaca]|uniref:LppM family (lipo)protein n=1 Tax=Demequina aurantiaca TaxID=676200 RepID=UPI0007860746|nr:hypothetical protein [Demequina aurantiaca]